MPYMHDTDDTTTTSFRPESRSHGAQSQFVYLVVDGEVFLDIYVRGGQVGLGLVIIVIRDVIVHGVVGKKSSHLLVELGRQCLVVAKHEGGFVHVGDDVGHGESLARAGHAQQHLGRVAAQHAVGELLDGLWLVASGLVF